jgi:hypothetical protein
MQVCSVTDVKNAGNEAELILLSVNIAGLRVRLMLQSDCHRCELRYRPYFLTDMAASKYSGV